MAPVLEGNINFQDILAELRKRADQHILVEQDFASRPCLPEKAIAT